MSRLWPNAHVYLALDLYKQNIQSDEIARQLSDDARQYTAQAVRAKLSKMFRKRRSPTRYQIAQDSRFVLAMLQAKRDGTETVSLGIVKDRRPFNGVFIRPEPSVSICGSSSQSCAEISSDQSEFSELAVLAR